MKANGKMIKLMAMGCMCMPKQEQDMKDIGRRTCSMDQGLKYTPMVIDMKGCSSKAKEMEKALIIYQTVLYTRVNG